ncbi:MAG TPA: DegT/DnrJ/EryC1/StrS family aminotransferase [Acidimicrobiia bacterium]|nr:DegT/DnrJ/EryC1/StrS family aminotransferase [Acidimicrobiia bacterium]
MDLAPQHSLISHAIEQGWARVMDAGTFIQGVEVKAFEEAYATFCGVRHCVGLASGTDALEFSLRALGVGAGDEVIVPTNSFIASAAAVARAGATPVLTDVDPEFLLIDPEDAGARVTSKTKAVIAVHLFGQLAPMEELGRAVGNKVLVVEDAAQAHGASRNGVGAGGFGVAAGTSFYPWKNIGAYGYAGAVLTQDDEVARRVGTLRDHGSEVKYQHSELGFNSRLDTIQAVVLGAKLRFLRAWNQERREAAVRYDELLQKLGEVVRPKVLAGNEHVWHLYVVRVPNRDEVLAKLQSVGIGAGIHYPTPIHLQGAFGDLGYRSGDFPVSEKASGEILSLPIYPGISPEQQERVVEQLRKALG